MNSVHTWSSLPQQSESESKPLGQRDTAIYKVEHSIWQNRSRACNTGGGGGWHQQYVPSEISHDSQPAAPCPSTSPRLEHQRGTVMMDTCRSSSPSEELMHHRLCVCVCVCACGNTAMFKTEAHREQEVKWVLNVEQLLNGALQRAGSTRGLTELETALWQHCPSLPAGIWCIPLMLQSDSWNIIPDKSAGVQSVCARFIRKRQLQQTLLKG